MAQRFCTRRTGRRYDAPISNGHPQRRQCQSSDDACGTQAYVHDAKVYRRQRWHAGAGSRIGLTGNVSCRKWTRLHPLPLTRHGSRRLCNMLWDYGLETPFNAAFAALSFNCATNKRRLHYSISKTLTSRVATFKLNSRSSTICSAYETSPLSWCLANFSSSVNFRRSAFGLLRSL